MHTNFEKLTEEKRKRIIDACIKEFSLSGYMNASTNNIVKEAGISKGALFVYFRNKQELYLYVLDYAIEYYIDYMQKRMKVNDPDFFQRILDWAELKIDISTEEPEVYNFFASAFFNVPEILKDDIEIRYKKLYETGYKLSVEGIDWTKFRDDIDKQKALELIMLSLNGILEKKIKSYKALDDNGYGKRYQSYKELEEYVDLLRKVFYK
ncbi:MAG: TetR/AcrR family transcriptional regulator [Bacillota bacterium]|nr:TetR/AcrR family transcriptional regulator [Bacillota bacterium]